MLGSAIVRTLQAAGYENILTCTHDEVDLTRPDYISELFYKEHPDYVFMAAGKVGGIQANIDHRAAFLADNTRMAMNVIDACAEYQVQLCYIGSSCMYPRDCPQPMKKEYLLTGSFESTNEGYALAKTVGMKYAQYRLPDSVIPIPCNLYGQGDHYDEQNSHVFPALIKKFVDAKEADLPFVTLWGSGYAKREFMHVDDCALALVHLMEGKVRGVINVGSEDEISIRDLASLIAEIVEYKGSIEWDARRINGMPRKLMDSSQLYELGWRRLIWLEEGIRRTIADYKAQKVIA